MNFKIIYFIIVVESNNQLKIFQYFYKLFASFFKSKSAEHSKETPVISFHSNASSYHSRRRTPSLKLPPLINEASRAQEVNH